MKIILVFVLCYLSNPCFSQIPKVLSFDDFMEIVKEHPVMYQAQLLDDMAQSNKRIARGGFDPKIEAGLDHKSFDGKNYYSLANGTVKVPTWFGIDLKAGYDRNGGVFLNESDVLPARGLWNAGISLPLGKGLVIDERRAALKRAEILQQKNEQERNVLINELLFQASMAYLKWQTEKAFLDIASEGVDLADDRLNGTRQGFLNGDKPAIDTLESFISLQTRQLDYQKAEQYYQNATIALNNYLWIDGELPLELTEGTLPEKMNRTILSTTIDSLQLIQNQWISSHPELLLYDYKLAEINIDQRLAKEALKPDLRLDYNPLVAVAEDALFDQLSAENYKIRASFSYPIMQRKERGKLQLTKLKLRDITYDRLSKRQTLTVKLDTYINNINQAQNQYNLLAETVENYNKMLIAENRKLGVGESSIFLVNSRESKYLESRNKLINATLKVVENKIIYLFYSAQMKVL